MADTEELKNMIMNFRVSELQVLLGFAGRNKSGKKQELQSRSLELLKLRSAPIQMKIKELHKRRFHVVSMPGNCDPPDVPNIKCALPGMTTTIKGSNYSLPRGAGLPPNALNHHSNLNFPSAHNKNLPNVVSAQVASTSYPVHPDVHFKLLPFYDVLGELLRPASLIPSGNGRFQENTFVFHLSPTQAHDVAVSRDLRPVSKDEFDVQIQLRFCLLETSCEQDDNFPPSICVKVNNKICSLPNPIPTNKPGVEPKRPSRPVNITGLCRLSPTVSNTVAVSWATEYGRAYVVGIYLVRRLAASTLLQRLKAGGIRNPDHTRAMIKEKLQQDPDSEIATTSLRGSLICPLGKMKMDIPCRPITCTHLQCFDANFFILMNEKKPTWICPVCDKPAAFKSLAIDGFFMEISAQAPADCTDIQFHEDGSWTPIRKVKETFLISPSLERSPEREIVISTNSNKKKKIEIVDLTLDSDTEDEWPASPKSPPLACTKSYKTARSQSPPSIGIQAVYPSTSVISLSSPPSSSSYSYPSASGTSSPSGTSKYNHNKRVKTPLATSASSTSLSSGQYSMSLLNMPPSGSNGRSASSTTTVSSNRGNMNSGNSTSRRSPAAGNAIYGSIPLISPATPPYYPPASSPFRDFITNGTQVFAGYSNFDLFSLLQTTDNDRQVSSYQSVNSANRNASNSTPDVISLD